MEVELDCCNKPYGEHPVRLTGWHIAIRTKLFTANKKVDSECIVGKFNCSVIRFHYNPLIP